MNPVKYAADECGIQITRKNCKSATIARLEAVNTCRRLWKTLGLDMSYGILNAVSQEDRDNRLSIYHDIAAMLLGDDVPEFEINT